MAKKLLNSDQTLLFVDAIFVSPGDLHVSDVEVEPLLCTCTACDRSTKACVRVCHSMEGALGRNIKSTFLSRVL